jgi:hypothetical protein
MAAGGRLLHMAGLKGHQKPVRSLAFTPGRCWMFSVKFESYGTYMAGYGFFWAFSG